ncbi:MAG: M28 family peptidase [Bacteroidales bacterium]|nr:M28 family peptidase [Bacteroidales bacterium]
MNKIKKFIFPIKVVILLVINICYYEIIFSQDINYAREIIDTLCSEYMSGRGYVNNGHIKASDYITGEFRRMELDSLSDSYLQYFQISVNSFPDNISVKINDNELVSGEDFIIGSSSPSIKGTFESIYLEKHTFEDSNKLSNFLTNLSDKFIVIDLSEFKNSKNKSNNTIKKFIEFLINTDTYNYKGLIIINDKKLTWNNAGYCVRKPFVEILKTAIKNKINSITVEIENKYIQNQKTQNVICKISGKTNPDSLIVFTAHYDHLGKMGKATIFPGANDNASGIAMLLNLAGYYSVKENQPDYSIVFIALGAEEIGLLGSKYFTENPLIALDKIRFLINFDLAGTGDEGIQVVNGTIFKKEFGLLQNINNEKEFLPQVKIRGESCNSDHCMFYKKNVPCFFIYTLGGIKAYHDIYDRPETLPLTKFNEYFKLIVEFVDALCASE